MGELKAKCNGCSGCVWISIIRFDSQPPQQSRLHRCNRRFQASRDDLVVYSALSKAPDASSAPHAARWFSHIQALLGARCDSPCPRLSQLRNAKLYKMFEAFRHQVRCVESRLNQALDALLATAHQKAWSLLCTLAGLSPPGPVPAGTLLAYTIGSHHKFAAHSRS